MGGIDLTLNTTLFGGTVNKTFPGVVQINGTSDMGALDHHRRHCRSRWNDELLRETSSSRPAARSLAPGTVDGTINTPGPLRWSTPCAILTSGNVFGAFGILSSGTAGIGTAFAGAGIVTLQIGGNDPGTGYDQINVTGVPPLATRRSTSLWPAASSPPSARLTCSSIKNGSVPTTGAFIGQLGSYAGLPQGSIIPLTNNTGTYNFTLSYVAGPGSNDVVLNLRRHRGYHGNGFPIRHRPPPRFRAPTSPIPSSLTTPAPATPPV